MHRHGGGYSKNRTFNFPSYENLHSYEIDYNQREKMQMADPDQSKYLIEHPELEENRDITNDLVLDRFAIILYYYRSDNKEEKKWANTRIWVETVAYTKLYFKNHSIQKPDIYGDMMQDSYDYINKQMDKFKYNCSISTYLNLTLKHVTTRQLAYYTLGTTIHYAKQINQFYRAKSKLEAMGFTDPTSEEICLELGPGWTIQMVEDIQQRAMFEVKYLLENEKASEIPDEFNVPDKTYLKKEKNDALYNALEELSPVAKEIVLFRFGLNPRSKYEILSLKKVAKIFKISYDETRKIFNKALKKLSGNRYLKNILFDNSIHKSSNESGITKNDAKSKFFADLDNDDDIIDGFKKDDE